MARLAALLENADNHYGDGYLLDDRKRKQGLTIKTKCPVECGAKYKHYSKGGIAFLSGHKKMVRTCLVLKMNECYSLHDDPSLAEAAAQNLIE